MASDRESIGVLTPLVGYHLRRASGAFSVDYAAAMDGTGLRQVPFAVLSVIAANSGINQGAVGRVLGIKRANMVALINELIDKGLVDRTTDPVDRRAFALTLTATGADVLNDCVARIEAHEQRMPMKRRMAMVGTAAYLEGEELKDKAKEHGLFGQHATSHSLGHMLAHMVFPKQSEGMDFKGQTPKMTNPVTGMVDRVMGRDPASQPSMSMDAPSFEMSLDAPAPPKAVPTTPRMGM